MRYIYEIFKDLNYTYQVNKYPITFRNKCYISFRYNDKDIFIKSSNLLKNIDEAHTKSVMHKSYMINNSMNESKFINEIIRGLRVNWSKFSVFRPELIERYRVHISDNISYTEF